MTKKKAQRDRIDYVNESLRDGIKVLRVIIGAPTRGYTVRDVQRLSGLNYDPCRRLIFTLEHLGLARQTSSGTWKPGDIREALGAQSFSNASSSLLPSPDVAALADSMR